MWAGGATALDSGLCMCKRMYVCMCVCVCTFIYLCIYIYIYIHIYIYLHISHNKLARLPHNYILWEWHNWVHLQCHVSPPSFLLLLLANFILPIPSAWVGPSFIAFVEGRRGHTAPDDESWSSRASRSFAFVTKQMTLLWQTQSCGTRLIYMWQNDWLQ